MKLSFRQRFFSWFDSYDIFDEGGKTVFTVEGKLAWGHKLVVYDSARYELGTVREVVFSIPKRFEIYLRDNYVGCIRKRFTLFKDSFDVDCNGWRVQGDWFNWDYAVYGANGSLVARISKELFHFTDTYTIDIPNPNDALCALMIVLAIDAEKCSN